MTGIYVAGICLCINMRSREGVISPRVLGSMYIYIYVERLYIYTHRFIRVCTPMYVCVSVRTYVYMLCIYVFTLPGPHIRFLRNFIQWTHRLMGVALSARQVTKTATDEIRLAQAATHVSRKTGPVKYRFGVLLFKA